MKFPLWKKILVLTITLLGFYFFLPNVVTSNFLPKDKLNLGLDLRGGSSLLLEVGFDDYLAETIDSFSDVIRDNLKKADIKYNSLNILPNKISFTSDADISSIKKAINNNDIDITNTANNYVITYNDDYIKDVRKQVLSQSIEIIRRRVDATGTKEPSIQRKGDSRILLQVPGLQNPEQLKKMLGKTAKLTFHMVEDVIGKGVAIGRIGTKIITDDNGLKYQITKRPLLTGEHLIKAFPTQSESRNPAVGFNFNSYGAKKFGDITTNNTGRLFAVLLDGKAITIPQINEPILSGSGIITGSKSLTEAKELATLLQAGALPAPLDIIEERTVGPSLGEDSIAAGKLASIVAMVLVALFMIYAYRIFGVFSVISLLLNLVFLLAVLSLFQASLTLPGIAGIILTIGMAVDANVLIFERIKEEQKKQSLGSNKANLNKAKQYAKAVDQGFAKAITTILDSNITTLIIALFLFQFGSGPVKGFAVTLSFGILCSMFTSIMVTRFLIYLRGKVRETKAT